MLYRFAELELDTVKGQVRRDGEALEIGGLTLAFLTALVEAAPNSLDADALAGKVWRRKHVTDETIRKRASLVRTAVGAELIRTLPDGCYVLSAPVMEIDAVGAAPIKAAGAPMGALIRRAMLAGAVFIAILLGLTIWSGLRSEAPPRLVNPDTGDVLEAPER